MLSPSRGQDIGLDPRLKNIVVRSQWGSRPISNSLSAITDNEYLYAAGCRAVLYAVDAKKAGTKTVLPHYNEVTSILSMHLSTCKTYVGLSVQRKGKSNAAVGLVYSVKGDPTARPKQITHELEPSGQAPDKRRSMRKATVVKLRYTGMAFSGDARLLACHCNHMDTGILIYDWSLQNLMRTIEVKAMLMHVSFNPKNDTKLCATGHNGTFQFWHYGPRAAHVAPIEGLPAGNSELLYLRHEWIASDCVVAACNSGDISLVQGCTQLQRVPAFDQDGDSCERVHSKPTRFLIRKQKLFCFSDQNHVSIFDIKQLEVSGGHQWSLELTSRFCLGGVDEAIGVTWAVSNEKVLSLTALSPGGLYNYDLSNVHVLAYDDDMEENASVDSPQRKPGTLLEDSSMGEDMPRGSSLSSKRSGSAAKIIPMTRDSISSKTAISKHNGIGSEFRWGSLRPEKVVMRGHQGDVASLSICQRSSIMASASCTDRTLRTWDYNMTNQSDVMVDDFSDRSTDIPNTLALHPSGLHAFVGCEDFAIEYAVTESRFEMTKKIPVKIALVCPSGEPFVNSSPVTLVKYSHGGQLIAIVTGRLVQIFHLYNLDYSSDKTGAPTRVMAMTEHNAAVTDLAFSQDDAKLYTTSQDGAVYEWTFGKATRDSDFVVKSVPALNIAVSPLMTTIVAYFESADVATEKSKRNTLTKRGSVSNILNQPTFQSAQAFSANVNKNRASMTSSGGGQIGASASTESTTADGQKKMFLAYFDDGHISATNGKVLPVDVPVTAIAFGLAECSKTDLSKPGEIFVMGLADGRIMISILPLPLRVIDDPSLLQIVVRATSTIAEVNTSFEEAKSAVTSPAASRAHTFSEDAAAGGLTELDELVEAVPDFEEQDVPLHGLDDAKCRSLAMHDGPVMSVQISPTGNWIITAGFDGCMFMCATTVRAKTLEIAQESVGGDNSVFLTDRTALLTNRDNLENMKQIVADAELEKNRSIAEMESDMKKHAQELTDRLQAELERRDAIIVKGREEQTRICRIMQEEIDSNKEKHETAMQELEVYYEKRLAQNQQYLQGMVQAYDEQLVHARKDIEDLQAEAERNMKKAQEDRLSVIGETDKQKAIMLQYCDYIAERNKEIFVELEDTHDVEKAKLKSDLVSKVDAINALKQKNRTDLAVVNRTVMLQREDLSDKDMKLLTQKQEIETLLAKMSRLDKSLSDATAEIVRRTEIAERWEYKAGVQQQQLLEIEKVRKALTTQLHSLREKMGPQWELLVKTEDRLKEVDTEYGQSLIDLSEKEAKLAHAGSIVQLMQKQLRELRAKLTRKDHSLNRAVKILTEFQLRMEEAKFENGRKITVKKVDSDAKDTYAVVSDAMGQDKIGSNKPNAKDISSKWQSGTKVMDVFSSTPEMDAALKRLKDILTTSAGIDAEAGPADEYLTEEQQLVQEQQRQMNLLQKNIVGLKSNIKLSSAVSSNKIHNFLHDNDYLLEQVNSLRQQVRHLTDENRMLAAREAFVEAKKISNSLSLDREDDCSEASRESIQSRKRTNKRKMSGHKPKSAEDIFSAVGTPAVASMQLSVISNSEFPAPPLSAAAPDIDCSSDDLMVGSMGLSRDDIIAHTLSEQSSIDRSMHVVIKGQSAADRKIAEILASNQKLIDELNIESGKKKTVHDVFLGDVRVEPNTPDFNLSRQTTAEDSYGQSRRVTKRVKSPEPPGPGKKLSAQLDSKKAPLTFGGAKPRQGLTTQGQIYAPAKTAVQMKRAQGVMRVSASVNSLTLPPVSMKKNSNSPKF